MAKTATAVALAAPLLPHDPGLPYRAVVAQHLHDEQFLHQIIAFGYSEINQRRGAIIQYDEIGFLAGFKISDNALQVKSGCAAQRGEV